MSFQNKGGPGFLVLLVGLILSFSLNAQEAETYNWFDATIGSTNTGLFNGVEYIEQHRNINENHKFFLADEFIEGTLHYDGQPYFSQPLKYNVFDKVLLVRAREGLNESIFQLIHDKIDGFEIGGHKFTNVKPGIHSRIQGFYEVLLENAEVQVLKEHSKYMNKLRDRKFLHYEFKPERKKYQLKYRDEFYEVDNQRDVIRIFPTAKKEIRNFYSSERALRKSNPDLFMISLFTELTEIVQKNNGTGS